MVCLRGEAHAEMDHASAVPSSACLVPSRTFSPILRCEARGLGRAPPAFRLPLKRACEVSLLILAQLLFPGVIGHRNRWAKGMERAHFNALVQHLGHQFTVMKVI